MAHCTRQSPETPASPKPALFHTRAQRVCVCACMCIYVCVCVCVPVFNVLLAAVTGWEEDALTCWGFGTTCESP